MNAWPAPPEHPAQARGGGQRGYCRAPDSSVPGGVAGGWNDRRTPVRLFDHEREGYSLLQPGDRVRFVAVTRDEFLALGGDVEAQG